MSLALRVGGLFPTIQQALRGGLPSLPAIGLSITLKPRITANASENITSQEDERLQDLRQQIENNNGNPPFMIDNGMILRAAPKKKLSHAKHRAKLYAPGNKQIHPLNNIVRCPACGHVKRSHFMCMNCYYEIKSFIKVLKRENGIIKDPVNPQSDLDAADKDLIYPTKVDRPNEVRFKQKEWIPVREKTLMFKLGEHRHTKKSR
ncbi:mitochondrial ribosomal large subunit protein [Scheffersomyces coipomensis]|uniref:mitochondrial ribosomal large subunit protein n=1 Tax=Scheffersomyces coipomensis TaxID=1788519 RepID=UPI00315CBF1B